MNGNQCLSAGHVNHADFRIFFSFNSIAYFRRCRDKTHTSINANLKQKIIKTNKRLKIKIDELQEKQREYITETEE